MRPRLAIAAVLVALAGCDAGGEGADASPSTGATVAEAALGPVTAVVRMEPTEPRFGDRVRLGLEVRAAPGTALEALEFGARLGHFRIRDRRDDSRLAEGRIDATVVAEPDRPGTNIVRWPPIRFSIASGEGAGREQELRIPAFEVEVAGLGPDQRADLAELGAPLPGVALPAERNTGTAVAVAALLAAAVLGLWLWGWRRRRRGAAAAAVEIDPRAEAARAFDELHRAGLAEQGRFAEFYVRLTGIVRRYIERTTGVHAPEQTTEEFLREMERHADFDADRRRGLGEFLAAADLVKYAAQVPTGAELQAAVAAARAFCGLGEVRGEEAA